jgi:hypothetical protein
MRKRIQKGMGAAAALAALALGGSVIAQAASTPAKPPAKSAVSAPEKTTGPDTDSVQSGDQSTPDAPDAADAAGSSSAAETPDTPGSESAADSDGPGGHADETSGNANAQHDFQGAE